MVLQEKAWRMRIIFGWMPVVAIAFLIVGWPAVGQERTTGTQRNVLIFVADGLRRGSVNEQDMPALAALRSQGVDFRDSYSLFPTFTMGNASAIATGHSPGDAGMFANTIWMGFSAFDTGNFNLAPGTPLPFLENDQVLADADSHYDGNLLGEDTLLALARAHGYNTAAIGKLGPTALQDIGAIAPVDRHYPSSLATIVVDDATGTAAGVPLAPQLTARLQKEGLPEEAPTRSNGYAPASAYNNGYSGNNARRGTLAANVHQQQWFADVATRAVLPLLESDAKPFALVFWSRDPDGTQHYQGDSHGTLVPGINGPTSRLAVQNADRNLRQLLTWLNDRPAIKANTDLIVTSDHGFATISRHEIDRSGRATTSEAAKHAYLDVGGRIETAAGMLPYGFLAIDLALDLHLNLFDPDRRGIDRARSPHKKLQLGPDTWEHPAVGNGLIGAAVQKLDGSDAHVIVAANGGSDLVYVPNKDPEGVRRIVGLLLGHDYVGGVFVDDRYGEIPGALPLSAIGLVGSSRLPRPDIVVAFRVFYLNPDDLQTAVQVSDSALQEGQGMHGGFGRESTYNTMAARGPDFKSGYIDGAPVSNADIAPTVAYLLGFDVKSNGSLRGRIVREALTGGSNPPLTETKHRLSSPMKGWQTSFYFEELDGERYGRAACLLSRDRQDQGTADACRR